MTCGSSLQMSTMQWSSTPVECRPFLGITATEYTDTDTPRCAHLAWHFRISYWTSHAYLCCRLRNSHTDGGSVIARFDRAKQPSLTSTPDQLGAHSQSGAASLLRLCRTLKEMWAVLLASAMSTTVTAISVFLRCRELDTRDMAHDHGSISWDVDQQLVDCMMMRTLPNLHSLCSN